MAVALLMVGCRTTKNISTQVQEYKRDSVRIEYRERTVLVPDTVYFEIPRQMAERTIADSVSHLENDYASSDARLNSDGTLTHTLNSKPQLKPVPTERKIEYRDSIIYKDRWRDKKQTVTEYVERKLSWWEQTQIYGFWTAIAIVAIIYRKKIFQTVVRLFLKK
jgi:hypothetical protein